MIQLEETYWHDAWNDVRCCDKWVKALYVNHCMCVYTNDSIFWVAQMTCITTLHKFTKHYFKGFDRLVVHMLINLLTECLNWRLMLRQMWNSLSNSASLCSQRYTKDSVFWLAKMMLYIMMLRNLPPFVEPNIISNAPTNRLSICQLKPRLTFSLVYSVFQFTDMLVYTSRTATQHMQFKVHGQVPLRGMIVSCPMVSSTFVSPGVQRSTVLAWYMSVKS